MFVHINRSIILCSTIMLTACTGTHLTQQEVARDFWTAMTANDLDEAKKYTKTGSESDLKSVQSTKIAKVELRHLSAKNGIATMPTTIISGEIDSTRPILFDTFLDQEKGEWKVDVEKTKQSMLKGVNPAVQP